MQGFLKDNFEHHAPEPPRDMWAGIESELHPKRKVGWLYYASAIAASIAVVIGIFWMLATGEKARSLHQPTTLAVAPVPAPMRPANNTVAIHPSGNATTHTRASHVQGAASPQGNNTIAASPTLPEKNETIAQQDNPRQGSGHQDAPKPAESYLSNPDPAVQPIAQDNGQSMAQAGLWHPGTQIPPTAIATVPAQSATKKREFDLSHISFDDVVLFAARSLSRITDLPFAVYADAEQPQQVRAYEVQVGGFAVERKKSH